MLVYVKTLTGHKRQFDIDLKETFADLKERISETEGIDQSQIRLIHQGNMVTLAKPIEELNVRAGDIIHMVLSLRGG
jgi:hypothetical protein